MRLVDYNKLRVNEHYKFSSSSTGFPSFEKEILNKSLITCHWCSNSVYIIKELPAKLTTYEMSSFAIDDTERRKYIRIMCINYNNLTLLRFYTSCNIAIPLPLIEL